MHPSALELMEDFRNKYLSAQAPTRILEVGAGDHHGGKKTLYRSLFQETPWSYVGSDIEALPNVDHIQPSPFDLGFPEGSFDVVISGQVLEHVTHPFKLVEAMGNVVKSDGLICLTAPWGWREHKYPLDCWRILPDGMRVLLEEAAGCEVLEIQKTSLEALRGDTHGVGRKK